MMFKYILHTLAAVQLKDDFIEVLEKNYNSVLPDVVKQIVSLSEDTVHYDDFSLIRGLSHDEIIDASTDMSVDFISKQLLPLFDLGDNDYIVYNVVEKTWYKFNIVDEIVFSKADDISEYFL